MDIAAIVKCSLVDYPGKIAAVIFTQGCNLKCSYCHNRELVTKDNKHRNTPASEIFSWLKTRSRLLDAVVVSGGEPTLQLDALEFITNVKQLGFLVKLDTNGTQPDVLASLINHGVLDYVAMDIKAPLEKYDDVCSTFVDQSAVEKSIRLLINGTLDYEFRTTIVPQLTLDDILAIGNRIRGAKAYVLQQCRTLKTSNTSGNKFWTAPKHTLPVDTEIHQCLNHIVKKCAFRGFKTTIQHEERQN